MTLGLNDIAFLLALAAPPLTVLVGLLWLVIAPAETAHRRIIVSSTKRSSATRSVNT
jgi:hypothetical protein